MLFYYKYLKNYDLNMYDASTAVNNEQVDQNECNW